MLKIKKLTGKNIVIIVVCLIIAGGLGFYFLRKAKSKTTVETVSYQAVQRGNLVDSIATTGKISSNLDIDIKCKASGEIVDLPHQVSDYVKKGDLLLRLNPVDEKQIVKQSEMTLLQSQAALAKARQDLLNSRTNLENTKRLAQADLQSAILKANESNTKINQSATLTATGRQSAQAAVESARVKARDLENKAADNRRLYNKGYLSQIEYETSEVAAKQAELDLRNSQAKLREAETVNKGDYTSAIAAASQARIDVDSASTRLKEQNDAAQDLKLKEQDIKSMEARVESDRASLQNSQQRLRDTEVFSPINGVVTNRFVQEGQIITSGISSVTEGTTVLTVSDFSRMFIMASVDESDIGKVKLNQRASITVDAFPGKRFRGKVMQIYSKGVNVSNVVTFTVKIEVLGKDKSMLKPEMTANVEIFTLRKNDVITVDSNAIISKNTGPGGRKYFVKVKAEKGEPQEREVKVGVNTTDKYEIVSGLKEGEQIVVNKSGSDNPWKRNGQNQNQNQQGGNQARRMMMGGFGGAGGGRRQ
jgi:HlyD family secretion protein